MEVVWTFELVATLATLGLMIVAFSSGKMGFGSIAICSIIILELCGVITPAEAWEGFSSTSIPLMVSMFVMGHALSKTSILEKATSKLIKDDASDRGIMLGLAIITLFFGLFVNGVATITMMVPIVNAVCIQRRKDPNRFIAPVAALGMFWAGLVPLGGNAGSYAISSEYIANMGGPANTIGYFTGMIARLPAGIAVLIFVVLFGTKFTPRVSSGLLEEGLVAAAAAEGKSKARKLTPQQEKLVYILFPAGIIGLIVGSVTGLYSSYIPTIIVAVLMVTLKIMTVKEAHSTVQPTVIMMSGGLIPISTALGKTGGTQLIGNLIQKLLGGTDNPFIICATFIFVCAVLTQFMSNSGVSNIFKPIAVAAAITAGFNPAAAFLSVTCASALACLTPMASTSQAIAVGAGRYTIGQYCKSNFMFFIVGTVTMAITIPLLLA